ncbi:MAG: hypothetical protein CM15mP85_18190 [Rhodobacterales bacterium]|nr:MAG: hypothetical protein CM15mP85_18190 [Rhodobacterales bacterium]
MVNNTLIELKKLLNSMETDLGLNSLSEVERKFICHKRPREGKWLS